MRNQKLLVVGAGPVGLGMADALKRAGMAYDQVEAGSGVGGNWRHGVYDAVHTVSSKHSTAYADYPMPETYPDFPSGREMLTYLQAYARDRDLMGQIEFDRQVVAVSPNADDSWSVRFQDGEARTYKGVVICNGHHWDPIEPELPSGFSGRVMHAKSYRGPSDIAGQRVLVIGGGNSGCDIASECARSAATADWSLRSGVWFLPKIAFGRPLTDLPIWRLPVFLQRLVLRALIGVLIGDYRRYGLPRPAHRIFERHPTFGTEALGYIRQGRIRPRPAIQSCEGSTVRFVDGTSGDYDLIVAATGYRLSFPFLAPGLVEVRNNAAQILGGAFPPGVKNLYIIGSEQPRNGFGAVLTPAAALYAKLIAMQDEFEHPLGSILKFGGDKLPSHPFVNPAKALSDIRWGARLLPLLRLQAWLLARREHYVPVARRATGEAFGSQLPAE